MIVTGGSTQDHLLSSTEIFTGGQWQYGPKIPTRMTNHCQVTSNAGVIVAGIDKDNTEHFVVYRLEEGQWKKMTEKKWKWRGRDGHSCELLDEKTMVVMGGGVQTARNVDILDLGSLSWSKGPELPKKINNGPSTVYQNTFFIIKTGTGLVYSIPTNLTGGWKTIAKLGRLPTRQAFPSPVFKKGEFK